MVGTTPQDGCRQFEFVLVKKIQAPRCLFQFKQTVHGTRNSLGCSTLKKVLLLEAPPRNFDLC